MSYPFGFLNTPNGCFPFVQIWKDQWWDVGDGGMLTEKHVYIYACQGIIMVRFGCMLMDLSLFPLHRAWSSH